jgi:hypothetical protein
MPFFDNGRNQFYPTEAIDRMAKSSKTRGGDEIEARIYFKRDPDRAMIVDDYTIDRIVRASQPVIPAQPGYRLLTFCFDPSEPGEAPWSSDEPVLGWRVDVQGGLEPVVIDYNFTTMDADHAILEPTGKVHAVDAAYDDLHSWMKYMTKAAVEKYERLKASAAKKVEGEAK